MKAVEVRKVWGSEVILGAHGDRMPLCSHERRKKGPSLFLAQDRIRPAGLSAVCSTLVKIYETCS